jgi:hypothetical protein
MKRFLISSILAAIVATGTAMMPQDYPDEYLGLPGDNFNLYAVMKLFQESETLEGFERSLNDENTRINNLDLNNDNYIDYIKVLDYVDGNVHTIVLQAVLDRNESQDVAVFTVQRLRNGSVQIQLVGDEALYGRNYIIEPYYAETPNPGYTGRANRYNTTVVRTTYVEVSAWPVIRFIYMPNYIVWRSSWYWGYYPVYWNPWRPYYWHYYYGYHYHWFPEYYGHFHRYDRHRWNGWDRYYFRDRRVYSRNVVLNINEGRYKTTYSRPEQRKEGEALYAKAHPERAATMSTSGNRRSATGVSSSRQGNGSSGTSSRRSSGTVNNGRASGRSQEGQPAATNRRSSATVNQNRTSVPSGNQSTGNVRKSSTTTGNERPGSNTSAGQDNDKMSRSSSGSGNGALNRSTGAVSNRANSGSAASGTTVTNRRASEPVVRSTPESGSRSSATRVESSRSSSRQEPAQSSTPRARRSTERAPKETVMKQSSKSSGKSKESENSSSRRK